MLVKEFVKYLNLTQEQFRVQVNQSFPLSRATLTRLCAGEKIPSYRLYLFAVKSLFSEEYELFIKLNELLVIIKEIDPKARIENSAIQCFDLNAGVIIPVYITPLDANRYVHFKYLVNTTFVDEIKKYLKDAGRIVVEVSLPLFDLEQGLQGNNYIPLNVLYKELDGSTFGANGYWERQLELSQAVLNVPVLTENRVQELLGFLCTSSEVSLYLYLSLLCREEVTLSQKEAMYTLLLPLFNKGIYSPILPYFFFSTEGQLAREAFEKNPHEVNEESKRIYEELCQSKSNPKYQEFLF